MEIAISVAIFLVGYLVGFYIKAWLERRREYNGVKYVTANEEKTLYSLELNDYPETLQFKKHVVFKVETAEPIEEAPNRK